MSERLRYDIRRLKNGEWCVFDQLNNRKIHGDHGVMLEGARSRAKWFNDTMGKQELVEWAQHEKDRCCAADEKE